MTGRPNIRMILSAIDLKPTSATIFSKIAAGDFRFGASQSNSAEVVSDEDSPGKAMRYILTC
jgi:hypothetical protein